jgi:hypothetical protein
MKLNITGHNPIWVSRSRVAVELRTGLVHCIRAGTDHTAACNQMLHHGYEVEERHIKQYTPTCLVCVTMAVWRPTFTS